VTYSAVADAWVDQGSAGSNKGSDSILKVMSKSGGNLRGLVQFGLPASLPEGCVVQSATLRLYAASPAAGRTMQAARVTGAWAEGSVTWNNQPASAGPAASTSSGSGYRQWDVTSHVQVMFASGVNNGFLIRDAVEGQDAEQQFHSREKGQNVPQLVVTFARTTPGTTTTLPSTSTSTTERPSSTTSPPPPPVECAATPVVYAADADAWIDQASATDNKGSDSILKVMSKSGANLRGLVRFGMPVSLPAACVVQSATLQLYAGSSAGGRTLQAVQVAGSWSEGSVTWETQPGTTGAPATASSGTGSRQWDVTAQVQAIFASGVNNGFLIRDLVEDQDAEQQFHAREKGDNPPQLVVTFAAVPTPATVTVAAPSTTAMSVPETTTTAAVTTLPEIATTAPPTTTLPQVTSTSTTMPPTTTTTTVQPTTTPPPTTTTSTTMPPTTTTTTATLPPTTTTPTGPAETP
jgi:hypothetical protein